MIKPEDVAEQTTTRTRRLADLEAFIDGQLVMMGLTDGAAVVKLPEVVPDILEDAATRYRAAGGMSKPLAWGFWSSGEALTVKGPGVSATTARRAGAASRPIRADPLIPSCPAHLCRYCRGTMKTTSKRKYQRVSPETEARSCRSCGCSRDEACDRDRATPRRCGAVQRSRAWRHGTGSSARQARAHPSRSGGC